MSAGVDYKSLYEQKSQAYDALQLTVIGLQQQLAQLQKMIFGSRHERFVPADPSSAQLSLDIQSEPVATAMITASKPVSYIRHTVTVDAKPVQHPGRMKLPESLRREQIIIEPSTDTADCKKIGEEITEVLEYEPGELYVKQYKRVKYANPGNGGIVIGQLPSPPVGKSYGG